MILAYLQLTHTHIQSIEHHQTANKRRSDTDDEFDDFGRLDDAKKAGENTEHPAFGTTGNLSGGRRFRIQATVTRAFLCVEDRGLPFKSEDAGMDVWFTQQNACVIG